MTEKLPQQERVRKVRIEGQDGERDLVVGVVITRTAFGASGEPRKEFLLVRRDLPNGQWYFPGGKVRKGETMKDALKREICEELGLEYGQGYEGKFEKLAADAYTIKDKRLAIVNVELPVDALQENPQIQQTDHIKGMIWTSDPLQYDLTTQARDILEAKLGLTETPIRKKMSNVSDDR